MTMNENIELITEGEGIPTGYARMKWVGEDLFTFFNATPEGKVLRYGDLGGLVCVNTRISKNGLIWVDEDSEVTWSTLKGQVYISNSQVSNANVEDSIIKKSTIKGNFVKVRADACQLHVASTIYENCTLDAVTNLGSVSDKYPDRFRNLTMIEGASLRGLGDLYRVSFDGFHLMMFPNRADSISCVISDNCNDFHKYFISHEIDEVIEESFPFIGTTLKEFFNLGVKVLDGGTYEIGDSVSGDVEGMYDDLHC